MTESAQGWGEQSPGNEVRNWDNRYNQVLKRDLVTELRRKDLQCPMLGIPERRL